MNSKGGAGQPEFMSTHPDPKNRAAKLRQLASSKKIRTYYARSRKQATRPLR